MKLKDMVMDTATRRVLLWARLMAKNPSASRFRGLKKVVKEFEELHEEEMLENLVSALEIEAEL